MRRKDYSPTPQQTDAVNRILHYLEGHHAEVKCYSGGKNGTCFMVEYMDFLPQGQVKQEVERIVEGIGRCIVIRRYSDNFMLNVLRNELRRNDIGIVDVVDGRLIAETFREFVRRKASLMAWT